MAIKTNVKRPTSSVMRLAHGTKVAAVRREWNARDRVYIVHDRSPEGCLLVSQRLPKIAAYINAHLCTHDCERVSAAGMYEAVNRTDGAHCGWHKLRWRVVSVPLKSAVAEVESRRQWCGSHAVHPTVTVLGQDDCWSMQPCTRSLLV